jgi:hypothetical protein
MMVAAQQCLGADKAVPTFCCCSFGCTVGLKGVVLYSCTAVLQAIAVQPLSSCSPSTFGHQLHLQRPTPMAANSPF